MTENKTEKANEAIITLLPEELRRPTQRLLTNMLQKGYIDQSMAPPVKSVAMACYLAVTKLMTADGMIPLEIFKADIDAAFREVLKNPVISKGKAKTYDELLAALTEERKADVIEKAVKQAKTSEEKVIQFPKPHKKGSATE